MNKKIYKNAINNLKKENVLTKNKKRDKIKKIINNV